MIKTMNLCKSSLYWLLYWLRFYTVLLGVAHRHDGPHGLWHPTPGGRNHVPTERHVRGPIFAARGRLHQHSLHKEDQVCACSEGQRIDTQPCKQKSTVRVALARAWKLLRIYFPRQIILFVARMTAPEVKYKGITQIYYKAATACPRAVTTHVGIISET